MSQNACFKEVPSLFEHLTCGTPVSHNNRSVCCAVRLFLCLASIFLTLFFCRWLCIAVFKMTLQCLVVALCFGVGVMAGKYSRDLNDPKPSGSDGQAVEFRIAKLNQVWEKAKRVRDMFETTETTVSSS